jgi:hypothetical protein
VRAGVLPSTAGSRMRTEAASVTLVKFTGETAGPGPRSDARPDTPAKAPCLRSSSGSGSSVARVPEPLIHTPCRSPRASSHRPGGCDRTGFERLGNNSPLLLAAPPRRRAKHVTFARRRILVSSLMSTIMCTRSALPQNGHRARRTMWERSTASVTAQSGHGGDRLPSSKRNGGDHPDPILRFTLTASRSFSK